MSEYGRSLSGAQPLDAARHLVTFFDDKFASVKYEDELTLPELAAEIRDFTDSSKGRLPWLKLARFGDTPTSKNCLRHNKNVLEITGIEIDYDAGEMSFDHAVSSLRQANIRGIVYTSASYVPVEKERWRVLCPTSRAQPADDRKGLVAMLNGVLGGVIAGESFNLSTAFYYGRVDTNPNHRVKVLDGDFIDTREDLEAGMIWRAAGKAAAGGQKPAPAAHPGAARGYELQDIRIMLDQCRARLPDGSGQWHNIVMSVTASLINKGWTDAQIYELTAPYADAGWGDDDVAKLIETGRTKWGVGDPDKAPDMAPIVAQAIADTAAAAAPAFPEPAEEPAWRERYVNGKPRPSLHNARAAIEHAGIVCSEDTFHGRMMIGRSAAASPSEPAPPFLGAVTDASVLALRFWLSDNYGLDLSEKHVREAVLALAHENAFNPVVDMLAEAEANWDGVGRLDRMAADIMGCEDTPLNARCLRKTMIAAVARARNPGCKFDTILVMESPEGWNKSSAWALLAGEGNFSDEAIIGKAGREVQEGLGGVWIHENAELAGMRKADIDVVKAFASRTTDRARPAYGRFSIEQPRHSIEVGTTNADRYLQSQTGNRRFWPVRMIRPVNLSQLRALRLQLWGEAANYQSEGEALTLEEELWAAAGVEQEERRVRHPWEDKLAVALRASAVAVPGLGVVGNGIVQSSGIEERVTTAVIMEHVLRLPVADWKRHGRDLAEVMRALGWTSAVFKNEGVAARGYTRPVTSVTDRTSKSN